MRCGQVSYGVQVRSLSDTAPSGRRAPRLQAKLWQPKVLCLCSEAIYLKIIAGLEAKFHVADTESNVALGRELKTDSFPNATQDRNTTQESDRPRADTPCEPECPSLLLLR